jgi:arabinose-5-phosphate isomerase
MPRTQQPRRSPRVLRKRGRSGRRTHPYVQIAREVCRAESQAIAAVAERLGDSFVQAVDLIVDCPGRVVVTGMGKSGFIAQKLSATLASTGTPSHYLHAADALHGDLGRVAGGDVLLALSNSGATEEILRLLGPVRRLGAKIVAITGTVESPLGQSADVVLDIGRIEEAGPMGLAPTTSAAALLAVGDALAMTVLENRPFGADEYALRHPGGFLGRNLIKVSELMRRNESNPLVPLHLPLRQVVVVMTETPGHPGCACVADDLGKLVGIFTDGDLRRLVERGRIDFDAPIRDLMCKGPLTVKEDDLAVDAAKVMRDARVDQLPVVDARGRATGLLDIQDLLASRIL